MTSRISLLLLAMLSGAPAYGSEDQQTGPYRFDGRANALLQIFFPPTVNPAGYAKAYLDRARTMKFSSRDEALEYHARSVNAGPGVAEPFKAAQEATESFWRSAHSTNGRAQELLKDVPLLEDLAKGLVRDKSRPPDLLEKALWQRDLICCLQAILHCESAGLPTRPKAGWKGARDALFNCLEQSLFTKADYKALQDRLPRTCSAAHFVSKCRCVLADNYLPLVVFGPAAGWYELPSDEEPGLHFQAYGGRNFIRIFMAVPGMSEAAFFDYWAQVTRRFGMGVTVSAKVPRLAAGTQTVLLRTFGVFLDDGSYADSRIPEEILVRVFKHEQATLDPTTSDGLGTLHYQYKLRRRKLLEDPPSLGLCRIRDADGQFYGFFAEVPERDSTEHLTTMRANCISCHSEVLFGASTIFSLCRRSPARPRPPMLEGGCLTRTGSCGWLVKQDSLQTIQNRLLSKALLNKAREKGP